MDITLQTALDFFHTRDDFLILTHKNPDGDTIGSAVALCRVLRALGKHASILENPGFTPRYARFLDSLVTDQPASCVVSVDVADVTLLPAPALVFAERVALALDHHATHRPFAENQLVDPGSAACGELIYDLLCALDVSLTREIADALYLAIATDTGCFVHNSTDARTHRIAAVLFSAGADAASINYTFFVQKTRTRVALERALYASIEFFGNGTVAIATLTRTTLEETGATDDDLDNIGSLTRAIEGVHLGIVIRELKDGTCKISLRSSPKINAAAIAGRFDGGGHVAAAGCSISADPSTAKQQVLAALTDAGVLA